MLTKRESRFTKLPRNPTSMAKFDWSIAIPGDRNIKIQIEKDEHFREIEITASEERLIDQVFKIP